MAAGKFVLTGIDESHKMAVDLATAFYPDLFPVPGNHLFCKMK